MTISSGEFAARAGGLCDGRPAPDSWALTGEDSGVAVLAASAGSDGHELQVLTVADDATDRQHRAFERAREHWLAHTAHEEFVPILSHGDTPRPWLAIEPAPPPAMDQWSPETVRAIMIDLAEAVWQIEATDWPSEISRGHLRLDPTTGSAQLCWPLGPSPKQFGGTEWVCTVGSELLTGSDPRPNARAVWPGDDAPPQLWQTIESVLIDPSTIESCYDLKRALLFGPAAPPGISRPPEPESPGQHDYPDQQPSREFSRRAVVGVLGLGALGVTGLFARGSGSSETEPSDSGGPPAASFEFEQGRTTLTVTHAGGDVIQAGQLAVRNTRVSGTGLNNWTDHEGYDATTPVSEGDLIVIDRGVLSMWQADVVWQSPSDNSVVVLENRKISEEDLYS